MVVFFVDSPPSLCRACVAAGVLYVGLCVLMLFLSQPQSAIEPVGFYKGQRLPTMGGGRSPKSVEPMRGERLSHMTTLLHSHMFTEQGIKLKWIKERLTRQGTALLHTCTCYELQIYLFCTAAAG